MSLSIERASVDIAKPNIKKNSPFFTPNKTTRFNKSFQLKKLKRLLSLKDAKIKEIKGTRHFSSFHLVCEEDKYKQIEKKIQNKILDISMKIINDNDIEEVNNEIKKSPSTNERKIKEKKDSISHLSNDSIHNKIITNLSKSICSHNAKEITNERNRRLKKIKNLYDSFGEDESDKDLEQGNYGLNPRSIFIDIYDILLLLSSSFCLFYLPFKLAKTKMLINNNEYFVLLMIDFSEIIYILDLIFGFFRWYYNNEFKLVSNSQMIIKNYFYGDFLFDLILAIPFYTIFRFLKSENAIYKTIYNESHFLLKILICFKTFKIFKLNKIKYNRVVYFLNRKFAKNYYLERIYQITNFVIIICSIFNIIICFHIYFAEQSYPNWIVLSNLQDKSFIDIYIASLYFVMATMTSVGYGDIVCISKEETFFQIILLSIGLVTYSWIISSVGDYVKNKSRVAMNFDRDMTKLEEIRIAYPNMPYKLYNKIQQHIQRMLTQSKKYEYNILISNLPYYLQNSVLFQIHKNEINKFIFFKDCDNSDFILKVLTHFIPIFSKKNIVLVGEGEFLENIFFIKNGRLSLEAIIDLDNITISIEKYLKYRFEEIEQIQELDDHENSFQKSKIIKSSEKDVKIKSKKLLTIINKQFDNIADISYLHESNIDQEIGKCDFHMEYQDLYQGNIQYIHVLDLLKNEYYGEILMFSNIPSPLSLKVKSKRVELYVLKKKDAFNIRKEYQNIWQRINKKSIHNIKSLKSLTLDIINRYCEMNGILVRNKEIVKYKTKIICKYDNPSNINQVSSKTKSKTMATSKLDGGKNKKASLRTSFRIIGFNENNKKKKKEKVKFKDELSSKFVQKKKFNNDIDKSNIAKKRKRKKSKSESPRRKNRTISKSSEINSSCCSYSSCSSSSSSLSLSLSEKTINKKLNKQSQEQMKNNNNQNNLLPNQNYCIYRNMSKYTSKRVPKIQGYNSTFASKSAKTFQVKNGTPNRVKKISTRNNPYYITSFSSFDGLNASNSNNLIYIKKESTINFYIPSSYKNINETAKGNYINNNYLQNLIQSLINYYNEKFQQFEKKYSNKLKYSKFLMVKNENQKINPGFINLNIKNDISENLFNNPENNINSFINQIEASFSISRKFKNFSMNDKNDFFKNISNENNFPRIKEIFIDNVDNKNMNSKNKEILSDSNNFNDDSNKNINDIFKSNVRNFQIKKNDIENNKFIENAKKNEKSKENLYSNDIIRNKFGNNIQEVNLNYVTNFCTIY